MIRFSPSKLAPVDLPGTFTPLQKWAYGAMLGVKRSRLGREAALEAERILGWDRLLLKDLTDEQCLWWLEWSKGALVVWGTQPPAAGMETLQQNIDRLLVEAAAARGSDL
jgi:hypothetical protein